MQNLNKAENISLLDKKIIEQKNIIVELRKELENLWEDTNEKRADNTPFDVPMSSEEYDEFAPLRNAERQGYIEIGRYDIIRCILKEEEIDQAEADLEELQYEMAELLGVDPDEYIEQTT